MSRARIANHRGTLEVNRCSKKMAKTYNSGYLSGFATRTEIALVGRPRQKRAQADTAGNIAI